MTLTPLREEIDHRTIKLLVGLIALSLGNLTNFFADTPIASISASYHAGGWSQSFFVGFLFAISAFLLAYNGLSTLEMVLSKVAAVAALGVALFPCRCGVHDEVVLYVHAASAGVMFLVLTAFCYLFFRRALQKGYAEAKARAVIYALCGIVILLSVALLAIDGLSGGIFSARIPRFTFYGEHAGLMAFGISWLTASRVLPLVTRKTERFSPFSEHVPK